MKTIILVCLLAVSLAQLSSNDFPITLEPGPVIFTPQNEFDVIPVEEESFDNSFVMTKGSIYIPIPRGKEAPSSDSSDDEFNMMKGSVYVPIPKDKTSFSSDSSDDEFSMMKGSVYVPTPRGKETDSSDSSDAFLA